MDDNNDDNDMMDQCTGIHSGKTIYAENLHRCLAKRKRDDRSHSPTPLHRSGSISSCTQGIFSDDDEFDSEDLNDHPAKSRRRGDTRAVSPASRILLPAPYYYYHDHSKDAVTEASTKNAPSIFLLTMHDILNREDLQSIICWMPHGRSWKILNKHAFEDRVLPVFFSRTKKMASFLSNARRWGFKRMKKGTDKDSFYNELFLRGLPHLCVQTKRSATAGTSSMVTAANHEPDFHVIGGQRPLPESMDHECQEYVERVSSRQYAEPLIPTRPVSSDAVELVGHNTINESFRPRTQRAHTNSDLANIAHGDGQQLTSNREHNHHEHGVQDCIENFRVDTGAAAGLFEMTRENMTSQETAANQKGSVIFWDSPYQHPLNNQQHPSPETLPFTVMDASQVYNALLEAFALGAMHGAEHAMRNAQF